MNRFHLADHLPHHTPDDLRYTQMVPYLWAMVALLAGLGFLMDTPANILAGLKTIVFTESALITDYILLAGPGAALVNAALVTAISICILYFSQDIFNGMTLVVLGLMAGFSLFGKNFLNIWPILLGSWLYSRLRRESFGVYSNIGLMATALSPVVTYTALRNGWGNPFIAALIGVAIGFIMPPLAAYTYRIQNGMNLYNVGFACGLVAFITVPLISSLGANPTTQYRWASGYNTPFALFLGGVCLFLIFAGFFLCRKPAWAVWAGYRLLLRTSGRAPSDYLRMYGAGPVLVNMGVNGMIGTAFILLAGGDLNGPTIGGIITIMGFSAFGKHARNILPVMLGVALGGMLMHWSISDPAVQLACLFCTTLAPISGYFGWPYGVLAGFIHSSVVLYTGSPVAGMNLYNNGFSGGLIAIVLYPCILAIARHRRPHIRDDSYFDSLEQDAPLASTANEELEEEELRPIDPQRQYKKTPYE